MKHIFVISNILFLLSSCGQTFNSNSGDSGLIALGSCTEAGTPAGDRYCAAEAVIRSKCINCHSGSHDEWSSFTNDADWINSGRVVAGSTASSGLISSLRNQGGNMPEDNPQIPDADYQVLLDWVGLIP